MTPVGDFGRLRQLDRPVVTTGEAAAVWETSGRTAGRRLEAMDEGGLVRRLRRGVWALDPEIPLFAVAPFLTAPFPAYVSFWSAFARHQMIEQIPRQVSVASLDRARVVVTTVGNFEIHHRLRTERLRGDAREGALRHRLRSRRVWGARVLPRALAAGRLRRPRAGEVDRADRERATANARLAPAGRG
jgi:hypothetical protein